MDRGSLLTSFMEVVMADLSINNTSAGSPFLGTFRLVRDTPLSASLRSVSAVARPSITDTVTLGSKPTLEPGGQINGPALGSPGFFDSYIEVMEQQRRTQAMLTQTLSRSGEKSSTERTSLLNNFQALQFRQSIYEKVFNLKSDIFQNRFDIIV